MILSLTLYFTYIALVQAPWLMTSQIRSCMHRIISFYNTLVLLILNFDSKYRSVEMFYCDLLIFQYGGLTFLIHPAHCITLLIAVWRRQVKNSSCAHCGVATRKVRFALRICSFSATTHASSSLSSSHFMLDTFNAVVIDYTWADVTSLVIAITMEVHWVWTKTELNCGNLSIITPRLFAARVFPLVYNTTHNQYASMRKFTTLHC